MQISHVIVKYSVSRKIRVPKPKATSPATNTKRNSACLGLGYLGMRQLESQSYKNPVRFKIPNLYYSRQRKYSNCRVSKASV